ncbi:MAG TPA: hypothetical protein VH724_14540 [Candidatus Angelobacter sp.]|nr:hypothetical protein [Candidatus Angelobacter sp.]
MKIARGIFIALLLAVPVTAQQPPTATEISFERVTRASRESLRDSAELPMRVTTDFSATDLAGHVRKHRTGKFDYDFHGFNPRSSNSTMNLRGLGLTRSGYKEATTTAIAATLAAVLVAPGAEHRFKMKVIDSPQPDIFVAEFAAEEDSFGTIHVEGLSTEKSSPEEKCQTLGWMRKAYLFRTICPGRLRVKMQKDDLSIKAFAFDAAGLPLPAEVDYLGEANITGYHVDIDFQKATLPGDPKPFVVPRHVVVTVATDKGKLVMAGEFALKK